LFSINMEFGFGEDQQLLQQVVRETAAKARSQSSAHRRAPLEMGSALLSRRLGAGSAAATAAAGA
jgi:hypothetical protein